MEMLLEQIKDPLTYQPRQQDLPAPYLARET